MLKKSTKNPETRLTTGRILYPIILEIYIPYFLKYREKDNIFKINDRLYEHKILNTNVKILENVNKTYKNMLVANRRPA